MSLNFDKFQENAEHVEINRLVKDKVRNNKPNESVEIFTKIVYGKDVSKYGKKVDDTMNNIKTLASAANDGNLQAKAELNAIRTITIEQPLMKRLAINDAMGQVTKVGYNEELKYEVYQLQGEMSRQQASSGAFVFPTVKKETRVMTTKTATGGTSFDYRELASGATDGMSRANEQVLTDITNQMVLSHINALRSAITAATTLKNYAEGITKTNVEAVRKVARRFGNVSIMGDYSAVNKLGDLASFQITSTSTDVAFPEYVMEEIMKTGLLKNYKGTIVVELPNSFNMTELNTAGDFYAPYLPTSDLWFVPKGLYSPLQIGIRGGLTSMTGNDLSTRSELTRYDIEYGNVVIKEYVPFLGYIYDSALDE
jgi:hypothetical protein